MPVGESSERARPGTGQSQGSSPVAARHVSSALAVYGRQYRGLLLDYRDIKAISGPEMPHTLDWAAIAIIFAIPFDTWTAHCPHDNTTSEFGKELDSLADAITFGVARAVGHDLGIPFPARIDPADLLAHLHQAGAFICFLFLIGGYGLARFNISTTRRRNPGRRGKYCVGMPIPAAGGFWVVSALCYGYPILAWWVAARWWCWWG